MTDKYRRNAIFLKAIFRIEKKCFFQKQKFWSQRGVRTTQISILKANGEELSSLSATFGREGIDPKCPRSVPTLTDPIIYLQKITLLHTQIYRGPSNYKKIHIFHQMCHLKKNILISEEKSEISLLDLRFFCAEHPYLVQSRVRTSCSYLRFLILL